jgi:hypothetical protein
LEVKTTIKVIYYNSLENFFIFAVINLVILRKLFTINTFTYV